MIRQNYILTANIQYKKNLKHTRTVRKFRTSLYLKKITNTILSIFSLSWIYFQQIRKKVEFLCIYCFITLWTCFKSDNRRMIKIISNIGLYNCMSLRLIFSDNLPQPIRAYFHFIE